MIWTLYRRGKSFTAFETNNNPTQKRQQRTRIRHGLQGHIDSSTQYLLQGATHNLITFSCVPWNLHNDWQLVALSNCLVLHSCCFSACLQRLCFFSSNNLKATTTFKTFPLAQNRKTPTKCLFCFAMFVNFVEAWSVDVTLCGIEWWMCNGFAVFFFSNLYIYFLQFETPAYVMCTSEFRISQNPSAHILWMVFFSLLLLTIVFVQVGLLFSILWDL